LALGVLSDAAAEPSVSPSLALHAGVFWPAYGNPNEAEADTGVGLGWSASTGLRIAHGATVGQIVPS
jgi:hypothetical protein